MIVHPGPAHDGPPSAASKAAVERFNDAKKLFAAPDLSPVRVATEADRDAVERLARLMHRLIGLVGGSEPAGAMCLAITSMWFTHDFQLVDMFFFVHPGNRR